MPKFVYTPEGADSREWDFEPRKLSSKEAELIERRTGMHFGSWLAALSSDSMLAFHALLFTYLRRENQSIQWDQIEFSFDEVGIKLSDEEVCDRFVELERQAKTGTLDENESLYLAALRSGATPELKAKVEATLEKDDAADESDGEEDSDPTPQASEPESEPTPLKRRKSA
jgi:hypothetical protein